MVLRGMLNGAFDGLDLRWAWSIELLEVDAVPLSVLLRQREDLSSSRTAFIEHLRCQRKKHEQYSNREFVYFIAKRPRLRLASWRPARIRGEYVELRVVAGGSRFAEKIRVPLQIVLDAAGPLPAPSDVRVAGDLLTFRFPGGPTITFSLFGFLTRAEVDLGLTSTIEYVGKTSNPATRPTNLEHRGLAETAHALDPVREEIVVFFNTFHVRAHADHGPLAVVASNSLTNQLDTRPEAEFIEKMLIDYFEPAQQSCVLSEERARLRGYEATLSSRGVGAVDLVYEVDGMNDLYRTGSARVPASYIHHVRRDLAPGATA